MAKSWLRQYPAGVPSEVAVDAWPSLVALLDESLHTHRERSACLCLGRSLRYAELDERSLQLAAWLQAQGLARGERVVVMLPNTPSFLVATLGVLRAGLVVVNVDPRSSARELEHVLKDAGARAIVVIDQAAATLQQALEKVPLQHVLLARLGDLLGPLKGRLVNQLAQRVRKLVPNFQLPGAVPFMAALARGKRLRPAHSRPALGPDDIAVLQYTGGTTGPSRGVVLLHRHVVAHLLQSRAWYAPALARIPPGEQPLTVGALPLHHAYGFHLIALLGLFTGGCTLLVPQAQDTGALLKTLARHRVHAFPGAESLFAALLRHPEMAHVDWSSLVLCIGGGMAVQPATAAAWAARTGCALCEGYGLSEAVASVCCNPVDNRGYSGHLGVPLPGTEVVLLDDAGCEVPAGTAGEIAIRGPQVMAGYWQRPDETARVMAPGGWLRSGDIGVMDEPGRLRLVDRKKDLIFVSGFNVYPGEVEDVLAQMPGVEECAVIGVPDERVGELVKAVVVRQGGGGSRPNEADVRAWCEANLTGYKRPRVVEFRSQLPKSTVGKVLRRALREAG
ncbi:long-chain fatty acid--CoA ligase [beta proteobacterium AAP121]|nr:long-chain fatty acid--CoA ligase [beta proteobacterium AAP65]KPF98306.1 long-chain fatty acid--CoA ligase [beta proteobacterium AAP121]